MPEPTAAAVGFEPVDPNSFQPIDPGSFTGTQAEPTQPTPEPEQPAPSESPAMPDMAKRYDPTTEKNIRAQFRKPTADSLLSGDRDLQNQTIADISIDDPYMAAMARTALDMNEMRASSPSLFSRATKAVSGAVDATRDGLIDAPMNIIRGTADALDNAIKLGTSVGNMVTPDEYTVETDNVSLFEQSHDSQSFVRDATAFTAGFLGANKVLGFVPVLAKAGAVATTARAALAAGIGSAVTMDATPDARLSDFISSNPHLNNPITDFLSANVYTLDADGKSIVTSKDESDAMGRLRNGLENTLAGPIVDKMMGVIAGAAKWAVGKVRPGTPEAAAIEQEIAAAVKKVDDEAAQPPQVDEPVVAGAPEVPPAAVVPEAAPTVAPTAPYQLPESLSKIKPRYGYKDQNYTLDFKDDFDRATYTLANTGTKSNRHDEILQSLVEATGMDEAALVAHGRGVRASIKEQAKNGTGGLLTIDRVRAADAPPVKPMAASGGSGGKVPPDAPSAAPQPEPLPPQRVIPQDAADRILAAAQNGVSPEDSLRHVNINVPKLTDSVTTANIIHQTALELPEGALATPGWTLEQNAKEAASLLGVGSTEFMNGLTALAGSAENIPKYLVASRMVIAHKSGELQLLSRKIIGPLSSPEAQKQWLDKLAEVEHLRKPFLELQAGGARGVTSGNTKVTAAELPDGSVVGQAADAQGKPLAQTTGKPVDPAAKPIEPEQATIQEAGRATGLSPEQAEMAAKLAVIDPSDWKAAAKVVGAMGKGLDVFNEVYINAILSSAKTLVANLASVVTIAGQPIEKMIGGSISATFGSRVGKDAMLEGVSHLMSLKSATFDIISAMKTGFDSPVLKTLKKEAGVLDKSHGTVDTPHAITAANLMPDSLQGSSVAGAVDAIGQFIRVPTRLMTTTDELLKQINYRAFVMARATREGMFKKLEGDDLKNFVEDYIGKAYDETGAGTHAAALYNSQTATFTNPLLPGTIGAGLSKLATSHPVVRTILPFIRTPANIIRGVGMRTPGLQFAYEEFRKDIKAGGYKRAEALGKIATGTTLYTAAGILAGSDVLTGGGPKDPVLKAQKMATGWQPYSVKVGESYYGYNKLDPIGMFLGLAADFHEVSGQMDEGTSSDLAMNMAVALMRNLSSKTYLQGLTNALDAIAKPETAGRRFVNSLASGAVPYSGFSKSLNAQIDPYMNDNRTLLDSVRSSIPGYGATVPPRRNLLGEPILVPGGLGPDMLSPVATSTNLKDSVKTEISRLNHPFAIPKPQVGNLDLRDYLGKNNQSAYERYQELVGTVERNGVTIKDALANLIESPKYKENGTDNDPLIGQGSRVGDIQVILQKHREAALKQLKEEYPKLKQDMGQDRMNQKDLKHNRLDQIQKIAQ